MKKWLDKYQSKGEVKSPYKYKSQNLVNPNFNGLATTIYNVTPKSLKVTKNNNKKRIPIKLQNQIFANNTRKNVLDNRRNYYFPYETEQTKEIRNLADDQVFKSSGDLISSTVPVGAIINALYQGVDQTLPAEGLRYLPNKIPFKQARGYNRLIPILKPASRLIDPFQMFDKLRIADSLYDSADSIDLYNQFKNGGLVSKNSLNRTVTCSNCGWSWKLSDGGEDPLTCHKCGGTIKMKNGGEQLDQYQSKGQVNFRDQLLQRNAPIVDRGNFSNVPYRKSDQIAMERQNATNKKIAQQELQQELSAKKAKEKGTAFTLPTGATKKYKDMNVKERSYVDAQVLKNKGRWNENQVEQPFLNNFNPITMLYNMGAGLGEAPLMSNVTNSYMPYVTGVAAPLTVGALAGIGANTTGQFINNLANPLAGTGELIDNLGNKYLPNASKINPWRFKEKPDAYYRQVFSANEIENPLVTKSMLKNNDPKGVNAFLNASESKFVNDANEPFELLKFPTRESLPYFNKGKVYYDKNYTKNIKDPELLIESKLSFKDYEDFYPAATNYISINPEQASQALQMSGDIRVLNPFSKEGHNLENYNLYQPHWLQGYKKIKPKNKKIITPQNTIVKVPKNEENVKSFTDMLGEMLFEPEEKKSFGKMVTDQIETENFVRDYNKNFKKRYKDYSDFKKEYTDFYNEQVNVFGRNPEEVDPEGIMKDLNDPNYLNEILGFNILPNARKNIARGLTGDYKGAYYNAQLDNGGRQLLPERGEGIFKLSADNFDKYEQVKPWEVLDKNYFIRQNKYGGPIVTNRGQWDYPGQTTIIPSNKITMKGVPYPVLGVDNTGYVQMMQPQMNYTFPGQYVTEYPMAQNGKEVKKSNIRQAYVDAYNNYYNRTFPAETLKDRQNIYNRIRPSDYFDLSNYARWMFNNQREEFDDPRSEEGFKIYLGLEDNPKYFSKSSYTPSINKNPNVKNYYKVDPQLEQEIFNTFKDKVKLNEVLQTDESEVISELDNTHKGYFKENGKEYIATTPIDKNILLGRPMISNARVLGKFNVSHGKDKKGEYISYSDQYDFPDSFQNKMKGIPYAIYNRIYYPKKQKGGQKTDWEIIK